MKKILPVILFFIFTQFAYADYQDDLGFNKSNLNAPVKSAQDIKQQNSTFNTSDNDPHEIKEKKIITNTSNKKNGTGNKNTSLKTKKSSNNSSQSEKSQNKAVKKPSNKVIPNTTKKGTTNKPKTNKINKGTIIVNKATTTPTNNQKSTLPEATTNMNQNSTTADILGDNKPITNVLPPYQEPLHPEATPAAPPTSTRNEGPDLPSSSIPSANDYSNKPTLQDRQSQQDHQLPSKENTSPNDEIMENNLNRPQDELDSNLNHDNPAAPSDTSNTTYNDKEELNNTFID